VKRAPFVRTLVVLAATAGLGAYLYLVESKRPPQDEKVKEKVFAGFKDARPSVNEITIARAADTVKLGKGGGGWRLLAPLQAPADGGEVDALLSGLETLEVDDVVAASPGDLATYGLATPRTTLTLTREGGAAPLGLLLGNTAPAAGGVYAKLPTAPRVFTVATYGVAALDKKPFDLRDRALLHAKRDEVKTLEVTTPRESYALRREPGGEWAFTRPLATRAGRWPVDGLLGALEGLRMEQVAAEDAADLKPFGLDPPAYRVRLGLNDGTTRVIEIGSAAGEKKHHAREASSRLVAVVPGALVDDLDKGMKELRARRLLDVAAYEVEGFDAQVAGTRKTFVRTGTKDKEGIDVYKWKRTAPTAADLETNTVQDALFLIGGLDADEFVDQPGPPEQYGLAAPALRLDLRHEGGKPPLWVEVGTRDGSWYARRAGDQGLLKLPPAKADQLVKAFGGL
jgi:hypothetical protein